MENFHYCICLLSLMEMTEFHGGDVFSIGLQHGLTGLYVLFEINLCVNDIDSVSLFSSHLIGISMECIKIS